MLISSRSYEEYLAMFALTPDELAGQVVVDVAAGGADFVARATAAGAHAVAVDAAYRWQWSDLAARLDDSVRTGLGIVDHYPNRFTWRWYGDRQARDAMRRRSAERFLTSVRESPSRYVAGELPRLPLRDGAADLVLCSHLLFTWADVLDRQWHEAAVIELARVGREVRIFPVVVQGTGDEVSWLAAMCEELRAAGLATDQVRVPYEFQVGADRMLVVSQRRG